MILMVCDRVCDTIGDMIGDQSVPLRRHIETFAPVEDSKALRDSIKAGKCHQDALQ